MAEKADYEELLRQLGAAASVRRELGRVLPDGCTGGTATTLALLGRDGEMRVGRLTELLGVDISVTSRHVAHLAAWGWIDRSPDPADRRSRILRLTPEGRARHAALSDRTARELAHRLHDWSDADLHHLTRLLSRLRADFDEPRLERDAGAGSGAGGDLDARARPSAGAESVGTAAWDLDAGADPRTTADLSDEPDACAEQTPAAPDRAGPSARAGARISRESVGHPGPVGHGVPDAGPEPDAPPTRTPMPHQALAPGQVPVPSQLPPARPRL